MAGWSTTWQRLGIEPAYAVLSRSVSVTTQQIPSLRYGMTTRKQDRTQCRPQETLHHGAALADAGLPRGQAAWGLGVCLEFLVRR